MKMYAKEVPENIAQSFWEKTENASIFTNPSFVKRITANVRYFLAFKGEEEICLWVVPLDENGDPRTLEFSYFNGPFFKIDINKLPPYKAYTLTLQAYSELIKLISIEFETIQFSLLPENSDIRAFQWWNYHEDASPRFDVSVRYSARVENLQQLSETDIISLFRSDDKRKKIRKLLRENTFQFTETASADFNEIISLYGQTLERTGGDFSSSTEAQLEEILELITEQRCGHVIALNCLNTKRLIGFQLLLHSKNVVYAVAQSVSPNHRNSNLGVYMIYRSLLISKENGFSVFDFNGANSPKRADDKHAFGAKITPYFELLLNQEF